MNTPERLGPIWRGRSRAPAGSQKFHTGRRTPPRVQSEDAATPSTRPKGEPEGRPGRALRRGQPPAAPGTLGRVDEPGARANWLDWLIARAGPGLFRAYCRTLRFEVEGEEQIQRRLREGGRIILASWHQRILAGVWYFRNYTPVIMISQSRDGERIRQIAEGVGWQVVSGSSSRGGVRALLAQVRRVREGAVGAHVVDGPRGPARIVKPGLVLLAQRSGAAIVPILVSAHWRIEVGSWDRMQIPLPLSRIRIRLGDPIEVPRELPEAEAEALRARIEALFEHEFENLDLLTRGANEPRSQPNS